MVEQKTKFEKQGSTPKLAENTRNAAPKCATEKKFRYLYRTKTIYV